MLLEYGSVYPDKVCSCVTSSVRYYLVLHGYIGPLLGSRQTFPQSNCVLRKLRSFSIIQGSVQRIKLTKVLLLHSRVSLISISIESFWRIDAAFLGSWRSFVGCGCSWYSFPTPWHFNFYLILPLDLSSRLSTFAR